MKKVLKKIKLCWKGLNWRFDNRFDRPEIWESLLVKDKYEIWTTVGGNPINCYSFWYWDEKVLYIWWIHWNEIWTVKLMKRWANLLGSDLGLFPKSCLEQKQIFVIPVLNVDGYKKAKNTPDYLNWGKFWKINFNGVDLNRNFPTTNWEKEACFFSSWKENYVSGGSSPASEPEVKALLDFINAQKIQTIYAFHNCRWTVFGRWENYEKDKKDYSLEKKVRDYSKFSKYRVFSEVEWKALKKKLKTGHMMSWAKENEIQVIEVETNTRWWSEWRRNKGALINSLKI